MKHPNHKGHHSDHSGAHAVGTAHHMANAHNPYDGLTAAEGGSGSEGKADEHLSEHPTKMELPALHHNAGKQE